MSKPKAIQECEYGKIPWTEWVDEYKPRLRPGGRDGDYQLETYGDDYNLVLQEIEQGNERLIWTILDCDGELVLSSGWAYINRMGYIICDEAVPENVYIEVEDY